MSDIEPGNRRYEQAKAILQSALDMAPELRNAYLEGACRNDPGLRTEVDSLIAAYDEAGTSFLASPLGAADDEDHGEEDLDLTGRRAGAYRLERLLGRGGMGAVYLASRDDGEFTKHVAVKFIRPSMATPALLKRFRTERQLLADIDHPKIARLLDGGTAEGGMPFFIMEYVQGETLAQTLARGPLAVPRAIDLAVSVAEVLDAVHAKGLVFRDLKPSNIMLTPDNGVKVLDFGIAKIMRGAADQESTTLTLTKPGRIVGSPRYMSPEQGLGQHVDARSDVFSFAVVIIEALTGHVPYAGQTRKDYVRNMIEAKPGASPPAVPAGLLTVLERCLKKSPADRYDSGRELVAALRAVPGLTGANASSRATKVLWGAVAALAVLVVAFAMWGTAQGRPAESALLKGRKLVVTWASTEKNPKVSPDLKWVSFISDRDGETRIWMIDRASGKEQSIVPPGGEVRSHVWAQSSDRVAYLARVGARTGITIMSIAGGKPRVFELPQPDTGLVLVRWVGDHIYYLADGSLWRFDLASERPTEVTTQRGAMRLRSADVSGDERHIVFAARVTVPKLEDPVSCIFYAALDGSEAVRLTEERFEPRGLRWKSASAREAVYVSDEAGTADIWQVDVATGRRQQLTVTDARESGVEASGDGTVLVYEQVREDAHLAMLDPGQKTPSATELTADSLSDLLPDASESGREVVFQRSTTIDMALGVLSATIQLAGEDLRVPSVRLGDGFAPQISRDGRWVAYSVWKPRLLAELWVTDLGQRRPVRVSDALPRFSYVAFPLTPTFGNMVWSPVGPRLFFLVEGPSQGQDVWSATPGDAGQPIAAEPVTHIGDDTASLADVRVSVDGKYLSYLLRSESRAISELYVVDLARKDGSVRFHEPAGFRLECPGWTVDGTIVVLRSDAAHTLTDVLLVTAGETRELGRLRDADGGSAVLDPQRRLLYFTRTVKRVQSLYAMSLDTGVTRLVFQGDPNGRAFSGIRVLTSGKLLFSFQSQNFDILSAEFGK